jgi:hypothetical protein
MGSTVDGRIIGENWGENLNKYGSLYEECHNSFESQAWMVGRVTMEKDFTEGKEPELVKASKSIKREAFIGDQEATSFAIAVDAHGKLGWEEMRSMAITSLKFSPSQSLMNICIIYKTNGYHTFSPEKRHWIFLLRLLSCMTCLK